MIFEKCFFKIFIAVIVFNNLYINEGISQDKNKRATFYIRLIDEKLNTPVVFANIINTTRDWWIISDTLGMARISVYSGDTLTISSLGYTLTKYHITDTVLKAPKPLIIRLKEKKYELKGVTISVLGTYESFRYRVLHMKIPDTLAKIKNQISFEKNKLPTYPLKEGMSIPLGSPITAIYNIFSKEAKSRRKLAEAIEKEDLIHVAEMKYNRTLVERITNLQGIKLDEFILKYRPSLDYLVSATEYEVIGRIIEDFEKYKTEKDSVGNKK